LTAVGAAPIRIRDGTAADMAAVTDIYCHHVRHGLGTFEESPPDRAEMTRRFDALRGQSFPYLLAESAETDSRGPTVLGFAYCGAYRPRPAYRFTVEDSIYVHPDRLGRGVGGLLLATLIERATALGFRQMVAVIGDRDNTGSIKLHEALGFGRVGHLASVGFKFGRWVDVVLLQRALGEGDSSAPPS